MNRKQRRQITKMINNSFDRIVPAGEKIIKDYNVAKLPMIDLKIIIDNLKLKQVDLDMRNFQIEFNKMLDEIYDFCEGRKGVDNAVFTGVILIAVEITKKNFINAMNPKK